MSTEINPEIEEAFQAWYHTEGVRTVAPSFEHWHEAYQRMAFYGAINYMNNRALEIEWDVEVMDEEMYELEGKVEAMSKLMKTLIRQNRK